MGTIESRGNGQAPPWRGACGSGGWLCLRPLAASGLLDSPGVTTLAKITGDPDLPGAPGAWEIFAHLLTVQLAEDGLHLALLFVAMALDPLIG